MSQSTLTERIGVVGTGAVARGLVRAAGPRGEVVVWARSHDSAQAAETALGGVAQVTTDLEVLAGATYVVESVVEDAEVKRALLARIGALVAPEAIVATTTSSLSIDALACASGRPERFAGIHFFNPVERMELVELAYPETAAEETRRRSEALCASLGKTGVEVPDVPGFVVNRLLFPYLFSAVRLLEQHGLEPATVDKCMRLGAGHPLGPLALLDLVGLDVSASIARSIDEPIPALINELIEAGKLGRKAGAGFYVYGR